MCPGRVAESELKCPTRTPTPTFPKFPTPTPYKVNKVWQSTILQQLASNGNRGTQQELCVSTEVSKEIVLLEQELLT